MPEIKLSEISNLRVREFIRLMGFPYIEAETPDHQTPGEEPEEQRPARDVVLKVIDLLKSA